MSIIRVEHSKKHPFIMTDRKVIDGHDLSWAAKGLWTYLIGRPDNWKIQVSHLCKIYCKKGGGEKAIYSILNELIEEGYCKREKPRGPKGEFQKPEYTIYEFKNKVPHRLERDAVERRADQRDAVEGDLNNKGVLESIDLLEINHKEQQQEPEAIASVVVSDDDEKYKIAADQYIEKLESKGIPHNKKAIHRTSRKEKWEPEIEIDPIEVTDRFSDDICYPSTKGIMFQCIKNRTEFGFLHPSGHAYLISWKDKSFLKRYNELLYKLGLIF